MNAPVNDNYGIVARSREACCEVDGDGNHLCRRCKVTVLSRTDMISCPPCAEIEKEEHRIAEEKRRWEQAVEDIKHRTVGAFRKVPSWSHLESAEAFAATIKHPPLIAFAERYSIEKGSALAIGPSGSGKTSSVARTLKRMRTDCTERSIEACGNLEESRKRDAELRRLASLIWTTGSELSRALREQRLGSGSEPELFQRAVAAPLLIIDELGPEPVTALGEIFDLVDRRYVAQLPTLVTSGLTKVDFSNRYGDAFIRRLCEKNRGHLIDVHPKVG